VYKRQLPGCKEDSATGPDDEGQAETAFEQKEAVETAAAGLPQDAKLVYIASPKVDESGKAATWTYVYYSPGANTYYEFSVTEDGVEQSTLSIPVSELSQTALPTVLVDSGVALTMAEANGGRNFRERHGDVDLEINLFMVDTTGMNLKKRISGPSADPIPVWEVWYVSEDAEAVAIVHGETGGLIVFQVLFERSQPLTAREAWKAGQARYGEVAVGQVVCVASSMVQPDGHNMNWSFSYKYNGQLRFLGFDGGMMGTPGPSPGGEVNSGWPHLPSGWIASDRALSIASPNGGNAYMASHTVSAIEAYCFPAGKGARGRSVAVWEVFYAVTPSEGLLVEVNATSGSIVQ
jgi:hypothetical protein